MNQLTYSNRRFPGAIRSGRGMRGGIHGGPVRQTGFSIVELMVALVIGIFITGGITAAYLGIKKAADRQDQMSAMQANVRAAFEYMSYDARMAGALGCFPVAGINSSVWSQTLTASWPLAYSVALEGYDTTTTTLTDPPTATTTASKWSNNTATTTGATAAIPVSSINAGGVIDGSDVLILRTTVGQPYRVIGNTTATTVTFDARSSSAACPVAANTRLSGICPSTHALVSSCTKAVVFTPTAVSGTAGTPGSGNLTMATSGQVFLSTDNAELFGLQTVVYFIGTGANGGASLFRTVYNGEIASPAPQELIENVESMQVTYGLDTTSPPDGIIDSYATAAAVTDWNSVVSVRVGLLLRSNTPLQADLRMPTTITVNGQSLTVPTTKYDRRAFVSTFAVRNHIKYMN